MKNCTYTLPNNVNFPIIWIDNGYTGTNVSNYAPRPYMQTSSWPGTNTTYALTTFDIIKLDWIYNVNLSFQQINQIKPEALHCDISLCVKTFARSHCDSGTLRDVFTSSEDLPLDTRPDLFLEWGVGDFLVPSWPASHPKPSLETLRAPNISLASGVYWHSVNTLLWLQIGIADNLRFTLDATNDNALLPIVQEAFLHGDVAQVLDDITTSLTTFLRSSPNSTVAAGTAQSPVTYVHVTWAWLAYPATLAFLAALFLLVCIVFSSERGALVWKSSNLALLYHGLDQVGDADVRPQSLEEMEDEAKQAWVQLTADGNGDVGLAGSRRTSQLLRTLLPCRHATIRGSGCYFSPQRSGETTAFKGCRAT